MTEVLVVIVLAFLVIAASTVLGPRLGVASPLLLVAIGIAASFVPFVGAAHIEPEWILEGLLPPLLYASAVSMPAMNFRREFGAIGGLSVLLVIGSALVLGLFFMLVLPGVGFAWGVALGAIISPTDAVATSIIKRTPVSKRVVAILDGESLLNDATALVLLRTAIVAVAASFSFWGTVGTFAYSVVIAVVVGFVVGRLNLIVRKRVTDPTVNTVISFAVPFVASVPVTLMYGSGLVAAVVAGLITGIRAPRDLSPQNRLSDSQNWRTVELLLEGIVFLTMGVQLKSIVENVQRDHQGVWAAVLIAVIALALVLLVRAIYVSGLLGVLSRSRARNAQLETRLQAMHERIGTPEGRQKTVERMNARPGIRGTQENLERFAARITRGLADIEYFRRQPLGWREGTIVVWAGMRGAVTVAAAQTLSADDTPDRSVLVLIAFVVAALSLSVQGGTIGPVVRWLSPKTDQAAVDEQNASERTSIMELLRTSGETVPAPPELTGDPTPEQFMQQKRYRLAVLNAQRAALLDARDNGTFDADALANGLANLDASQIAIEMRGEPADAE
ncbi:cation:proton antiporter [Humibacter ginsenosidimutans]|uniref:Sodium:proton antiporter n=1 Tax=Humibacter ginsenosidimutans TaxID=2599293 RepID=A0A5B8M6A0_9MICO|nr:sodium:proton antiporter [Humibacter ginsenosidimutans]QDZ15295.1 sodium:proton antiporter [Humibacter ginsenosidimutans]